MIGRPSQENTKNKELTGRPNVRNAAGTYKGKVLLSSFFFHRHPQKASNDGEERKRRRKN